MPASRGPSHARREVQLELAVLLYFAGDALAAREALHSYMDRPDRRAEHTGDAEQLNVFAAKLQLMAAT